MKIIIVAGTRPNFIKVAPLIHELCNYPDVELTFVHTGQHYDAAMNEVIFQDLDLPTPDINLGAHEKTNAAEVGVVLTRFEETLQTIKPDKIVLVGDVTSTLACTLAGAYLQIPVLHVEAGLRSFDRSMPEEINRMVVDRLSQDLFVTEESGVNNLKAEGIPEKHIHLVGNVMIDSLLQHLPKARKLPTLAPYHLKAHEYGYVTLHRPANVDDRNQLEKILQSLATIAQNLPLILPLHPRTTKNIKQFGLSRLTKSLQVVEPVTYLNALNLMSHAKMVLTDSGGIQEETTYLGIPCLTLRPNTERPVTTTLGTNTLVGTDTAMILNKVELIQSGSYKKGKIPPWWDGQTAKRIWKIILKG